MDSEEEATKLQWPDVLVIASYFLIVLAVGVWVSTSVSQQQRCSWIM